MKTLGSISLAVLLISSAFVSPAAIGAGPAGTLFEWQGGTPSKSTAVYVSDFDLDIWPGKPISGSPATASTSGQKKKETPAEQANRLVESVSANLLSAFEKAGYTARRLRAGEPRPEKGLRIQGVFAQVDEQSRVRRALIGSGLEPARLQLFVSVSNLGSPDQKPYEIAEAKSADGRYGPVITVSPYAPVAKFEMDKDTGEQGLKDLGVKMVAGLTALLNANPMSAPR